MDYINISPVIMFGGGVKRGFLYGESAPQRPCVAIKNPVSVSEIHATMVKTMGIGPKTSLNVERRPFYVTKDGQGQLINNLFG